jgi:membrane peptidoglycan carboxypeptidase
VSSNDFDGPYRSAGGRGSGDYSGSAQGTRRPQGAGGGQRAQDGGRNGDGYRGGYTRSNGNGSAAGGRQPSGGRPPAGGGRAYPPPEGWDADGIWRDSSIDAHYETGALPPVDQHSRGQARSSSGQARNSHRAGGRGQADGYGRGNGATAFHGDTGQRGPRGDEATRVQQAPGGYREAVRRFTGPITGPISDSWRRVGDRAGGRGPDGPRAFRGPRPGVGPNGKRIKRKGDWWRHWTWKKALAVAAGGACGIVILCLFGAYEYLYNTTSIPAALTSETQQNDIVYYSNGSAEIGTIGTVNRQDLTLNQIPKTLQNAYIAAEDKNFWTEGGISPTGILRSAFYDVFSRGNGNLNGGSTLTEEFVKNYYGLGLEQSASVKIREIILAEKLTKSKSKQWILENYLNTIFLGENSYGVAAAAQTYFGEPVSKLTIAQDALLGGLPQAPSTYPLVQYKSSLEARWQYVIGQMVKDGFITQAQANAQKFPTLLTWSDPARGEMASNINAANGDPWEPYVLSEVENELIQTDKVTQAQLNAGGLKIVTSINLQDEKDLYNAVGSVLSRSDLAEHGSQYSSLPLWALTGAEAQNPQTGAIVAIYPGQGQDQSAAACAANDCYDDTAMVDTEQVGSSFKPYVIAAAVEQGMDVQTSILDTSSYACIAPPSEGSTIYSQPVTEGMYEQATGNAPSYAPCPTDYFPEENDDGESIGHDVATGTGAYAGAIYAEDSVQDALAQSSNVAFTDLIHKTGTVGPQQIAEEVGAPASDFKSVAGTVGMALGEAQMTVDNQTSLVAMLADNGTYHSSHLIQYWQDGPDGPENLPVVKITQVLTASQASQVQYAMEKTTIDGTAAGIVQMSEDGREVIAKTGTTSSNHSGFFEGAIPQFAMAVGMFTSSQDTSNMSENLGMLDSEDASNIYPTMIWNAFANAAYGNVPVQNFLTPQFSGEKWNLLGPVPKAPPKPKAPSQPGHGHHHGLFPPTTPPVFPTGPVTYSPSPGQSQSPTPSQSGTPVFPQPGGGGNNGGAAQATSSTREAGFALGGTASVLPGSLLWVRISRRRRRRRRDSVR